MERSLINVKYYETYYFANSIRNVLYDQAPYLRLLDEFYGDDKHLLYVTPFPKYSALHSFIEFTVESIISEDVDNIDLDVRQDTLDRFSNIPIALESMKLTILPIEQAFLFHGIKHTSFVDWLSEKGKKFPDATKDDIFDYYSEMRLDEAYDELIAATVNGVFFVIFQNRSLLLVFNDMMSSLISGTSKNDIPENARKYFSKNGILKRVSIPKWVKRAVFFRDRGLCVNCQTDISGKLNISNKDNYDHIVALANGGLNDVSNIQLLCKSCNAKKRAGVALTTDYYENWY